MTIGTRSIGTVSVGHPTVDAASPGTTIAIDASLISGAAAGKAATPAVLAVLESSVIPGSAAGSATAGGAIVSAELDLLPAGTVSGAAIAPGDLVAVTLALTPGGASGRIPAPQTGGVWALRGVAPAALPEFSRPALAPGDLVLLGLQLIAGGAAGKALVKSSTAQTTFSVIPGSTHGAANAGGEHVGSSIGLVPGTAFGYDGLAYDDDLVLIAASTGP